MKTWTVVWGAIAGASTIAVAESLRRRGALRDRLEMKHYLPAHPCRVRTLISQVKREPDFIPGIRDVDILDAGPNWVRYKVHLPGGAFAIFYKTWEGNRVAWTSEDGSYGLRQTGLCQLIPRDGGTVAHLTVETSFDAPIIGAAVAAGAEPYAKSAFRAWLQNLSRFLEQQHAH